jgi:type VI secretion system protein ImpK
MQTLVNDPYEPTFGQTSPHTPSLREHMEDGFCLLSLLRQGYAPEHAARFNQQLDAFLASFERDARAQGKPQASIELARYAYCALMDEAILSSGLPLRDSWEQMPLQLRLFGEHLAGEGFFQRLETLLQAPAQHFEALEVFHTCLLLGFKGRYLLDNGERLEYIRQQVQREIQRVRGQDAAFSPHSLPARPRSAPRSPLPHWFLPAVLLGSCVGLYAAYRWLLLQQLNQALGL